LQKKWLEETVMRHGSIGLLQARFLLVLYLSLPTFHIEVEGMSVVALNADDVR